MIGALHRLAGVCFALPVLLLVVTGVPLQFTDRLHLGQRGVGWTWVHDAYGIHAPQELTISNGIAQLGDTVFWNDRQVEAADPLIGAKPLEVAAVVVTTREILLIPRDPRAAVERSATPGTAAAFGETPDFDLILETDRGLLESADLGATWHPARIDSITWHEAKSAPAEPAWQTRYRAAQLSWERWLMDLHSGRFFGPIGEWAMSFAALALIVLAFTGIYVWLRRRATT